MVVLQRSDVSRARVLNWLTIILSMAVFGGALRSFPGQSDGVKFVLLILAAMSVVAIVLGALQIFGRPPRSQALFFHTDDETVIATNALHEGFKLRFLRDILGENVVVLQDEQKIGRAHV